MVLEMVKVMVMEMMKVMVMEMVKVMVTVMVEVMVMVMVMVMVKVNSRRTNLALVLMCPENQIEEIRKHSFWDRVLIGRRMARSILE